MLRQEYEIQAAKITAVDELFAQQLPTITEEINVSGDQAEEKPKSNYNRKLFSKTASRK